MAKPQILVLHGYTQSAYIFSKKIGALRDCCDLHFIDGPIELDKSDLPNAEMYDIERFDESWTEIKELLSKQKFDGILGFSQGAGFAAALSAVLVNPDLRPEFKDVHPPFKFCITVGGFKIHDKAYDHLYPLPVSGDKTHFLHVIGDNDMIVTPERSASLVENSPNGRCERHPGGHFVPSSAPWRHFFLRYINSFNEGGSFGNVEGPQPTPESLVAKSLQGTPSSQSSNL
ncbi:FSH1-domain-containing protein [Wallemia mellicola]|uniref:FSH1-domain-containing protein n=1 Tax=Wallemia mellicola TaxID=1708541 RepID=A0A4T0MVN6_9BASI|nr:hypothetical protein E3Q24_02734 [Wallemia mellicola]TIB75986.1 hypothetical protein E3Q23_02044 [Wallemia mellicola]TIB77607.1 FSH1-domain-containing protein [Wallemia mellicola]TIB84613.1 FSH1-domain-containing protein [Wallemia mellicola]TIB87791.1 FSH1-domain-containing protein [Wallemia mellicola]